jgi:hypothetical protein
MHGVRLKSRNRENTLDLGFDMIRDIPAEIYRRFL